MTDFNGLSTRESVIYNVSRETSAIAHRKKQNLTQEEKMPNLSELLYYTGETSTQLVVWSFFIGIVIATIAGYLIKSKFGAFIRKLLENKIDSPEKAVTLEELGLQKKLFIKLGLKSHTNYKNMLVAITEDGKFYANNEYTNVAPTFKEFVVVKRKRTPDVIKESKTDEDTEAPLSGLARVLQTKEKLSAEKSAKNDETNSEKCAETTNETLETVLAETEKASEKPEKAVTEVKSQETLNNTDVETAGAEANIKHYSDLPKERVKFDVTKAKYYIPPEIHDRAYSLYHTKSGRANSLILIIALLVVLGLIATFSGNLISGFTDFVGGIKNPFSKPII